MANNQQWSLGQLWKNITNPHQGSWGKLPDFGISEFVKPTYAQKPPPPPPPPPRQWSEYNSQKYFA